MDDDLQMDLNIPTRQRDSIQSQFDRFHEQNPQVFAEAVKRAREMRATGRAQYSMHTILQKICWDTDIETTGRDFKINNNYSSRYARLIVEQYPEFEGFFQMRELTAE